MPQGRKKVPFSGKAKKEQLKAKRGSKLEGDGESSNYSRKAHHQRTRNKKSLLVHKADSEDESSSDVQKINFQPDKSGRATANRYALQFHKDSKEEIQKRKELARQSLQPVAETELEINGDDYFPKELDFPKRPQWSYEMSRQELESQENKYFRDYVSNLQQQLSLEQSNYELNLETWRQLWRVLEMSDIVLLIVDIRFPALMFPPSLYEYVTKTLKKDFILVLNKIDLAPAPLVAAWQHYFRDKYPELHIVMFTTLPGYNLMGQHSDKAGLQVRRRKGRQRMAAEGTQMLFDVCKSIVNDAVNLTSWQSKIKEEMNEEYEAEDKVEVGQTVELKTVDTSYFEHEKYHNGVLTIGCVGQPNVGKSSLMNAIMGKKVVSVSKTPGHTKHFQTIFLTPTVRLCDCPGLVFPSKVPKVLQVLMGSYPIAQFREPYNAVKYLAERLNLPKLLRIAHPEDDDTWSAMDVCDGWAKKRGFFTAKAARLDTYRAANQLLRMALDGKICLCLRPPEYTSNKEFWAKHPEVEKVKWIQARTQADSSGQEDEEYFSDLEQESLAGVQQTNSADTLSSEEGSEDGGDEEEDSSDEAVGLTSNTFAALQDD